MASTALADVAVTPTWTDLIVTHASAASVDTFIQNLGPKDLVVQVALGGASAPTTASGVFLVSLEGLAVNAAHIWIRADLGGQSNDKVGVTLL